MTWTFVDQAIGALCAWRENRGGGQQGMQSVLNVLANRAAARGTNVYTEATRLGQFSSISAPGNAELATWPTPAKAADYEAWEIALSLVEAAANGGLADITGGATLYYAEALPPSEHRLGKTITLLDGSVAPFPDGWNEAVVRQTGAIAGQLFFRED
jgi:hypothetical protein